MTIKPKKKVGKDKADQESTDSHPSVVGHAHAHGLNHSHPHQHGHFHHASGSETLLDKPPRVRTSPTGWLPSTSAHSHSHGIDEFGHGHSHSSLTSNLSGNSNFEYETHEVGSNHKRRHRSSPHRTVRKHRNHSNNIPTTSTNVANSSSSLVPLNDNDEDCEEDFSGYNSEDEHSQPPSAPENINEIEQWFEKALKEKKGFVLKKMGEDGACLFRSVADQVYGDQEMHGVVRNLCLDYMAKNAEFYSQYVTEDFKTYINRKRMDSCHGNHLEIQAITELFNRPVEVYQYSLEPMNTFDTAYKTDNAPIRLSYHGNVHYNSIVNPIAASIGVGLGLPGHQPGSAERNQMHDAMKHSENSHIEQTMLQDKIRETDWEVTQDSIEEQVARESYLQWLREQEKATRRTKGTTRTASATCSSSSEVNHSGQMEAGPVRSPRQLRSGNSSPQQPQQAVEDQFVPLPGSSKSPRHSPPQSSVMNLELGFQDAPKGATAGFSETSSLMNDLPPSLYGLSDWGEEDILAQVIAQSQQEYLDSLKKKKKATTTSSSSSSSFPSTSSTNNNCDQPGFSGASTSSYRSHSNS